MVILAYLMSQTYGVRNNYSQRIKGSRTTQTDLMCDIANMILRTMTQHFPENAVGANVIFHRRIARRFITARGTRPYIIQLCTIMLFQLLSQICSSEQGGALSFSEQRTFCSFMYLDILLQVSNINVLSRRIIIVADSLHVRSIRR